MPIRKKKPQKKCEKQNVFFLVQKFHTPEITGQAFGI
jgi:hypothetical protein